MIRSTTHSREYALGSFLVHCVLVLPVALGLGASHVFMSNTALGMNTECRLTVALDEPNALCTKVQKTP